MKIEFGITSEALHKQLDVPPSTVETEQLLADAIALCSHHSVLTDAEAVRARKRLLKMIKEKGSEETKQ